ncbi:germination protein YpeB [Pallidibacillus thermolactis]|jgi:spore germination protein|uniref:germination protein YpeB n=1 Tax=Pallidibacillus thermolactis TaxID=251051 RepID=UPI0021D9F1DA|nr:germination protein YpeB [Pallidibacillus thermolactis]MCU9599776.1 germination protein YpeB [Pallidibacillus thermolactis subsp. kokeshiiformis]
MIRNILIGVLTVGIIGTGVWGYQEHKEKNALLINAENNYQRAFHELTYNIDLLHDKIGTTLAMNSKKSLSPTLAEVWRLASETNNTVGELPLTLMTFNKTEEFLSKIGEFTYKTAVRDLDKDPLTQEEYNTLKELYKQSAEIQDELRKVQNTVLTDNLKWMDVETALASGKEPADNTIIDGFKTVEKKVEGYSESNLGPMVNSMEEKDHNYSTLPGKMITKDEAKEIARKYTDADKNAKINVVDNGEGAEFGFYSVSIKGKNKDINLDITKKGGHPIWGINNRPIGKAKISLNEASFKAEQFLKKRGFKNLKLYESLQYDNTGLFTFVTIKDDVLIYPESIRLKVALDNGSVIGFSAEEYLGKQKDRTIPKPKLTVDEAKSNINKNVEIMDYRMSLIENDLNEEVLCYEFIGTLDHDTYRIFINALDGNEEFVEKLYNPEPIYDNVIEGRA